VTRGRLPAALVAALLADACAGAASAGPASEGPACPDYRYESQFEYAVTPAFTTPSGIPVDPSGQDVSAETVDAQTAEVEACLAREFGSPPHLPPEVRRAADCLEETFALPIPRGCFAVKVPADWTLSCDGDQQVLPSRAPDALCLAKGLVPTDDCPCRWRAGLEDDGRVVVTTPSFHMFKDPLVRLATGCNNPWAHPKLARCATPSL
jgi:hypothetical protein